MKIVNLVEQRRFNAIVWILCFECLIYGLCGGSFVENNQTCTLNTVRDDVTWITWYKAAATLGVIKNMVKFYFVVMADVSVIINLSFKIIIQISWWNTRDEIALRWMPQTQWEVSVVFLRPQTIIWANVD